jgi:hypothetical protein
MKNLLRVPLFKDEVLTSFVSRTASANGKLSAREFCADFEISYRRLVGGNLDEIDKFAVLLDQNAADFRHHAILQQRDWTFLIAQEVIDMRHFNRDRLRFCPQCFLEDEANNKRMPGTRRYLRAAWLVPFVMACPRHNCKLEELARHTGSADLSTLLSTHPLEVQERTSRVTELRSTQFEAFIHDRLVGVKAHGDILDRMSLQAVISVSRHLGSVLSYGNDKAPTKLDAHQTRVAITLGFESLASGHDGFEKALDEVIARNSKKPSSVHAAYGRFATMLFRGSKAEYEIPRRLLINHAGERFTLRSGTMHRSKGDNVWTSVGRVSAITGLSHATVRRRMSERGMIQTSGDKISTGLATAFVQEMGNLIYKKAACDILQCDVTMFNALVAVDIIRRANITDKRVGRRRARGEFVDTEIKDLRDRLFARVTSVFKPDMISLRTVVRKFAVPRPVIISDLIAGKYQVVAHKSGAALLDSLFIDPREIQKSDPDRVSSVTAAKLLDVHSGTLAKLLATNVISFTDVSAGGRFGKRLVHRDEINAFKEKYASIGQLAKSSGLDRNTLLTRMRKRGIMPAFPYAQFGCCFVKIDSVSALLRDDRNSL